MDPLETIAKLKEAIPQVCQYLAEATPRIVDPKLRAQIQQVQQGMTEKFAQMSGELPGFLADLTARKEKADAELRRIHEEANALVQELEPLAREAIAKEAAEIDGLLRTSNPSGEADPPLGLRHRDDLLERYVGAELPPRPEEPKATVQDWAESLVSVALPPPRPVSPSSIRKPPPAAPAGKPGQPSENFENWLNSWFDSCLTGQSMQQPPPKKPIDDDE